MAPRMAMVLSVLAAVLFVGLAHAPPAKSAAGMSGAIKAPVVPERPEPDKVDKAIEKAVEFLKSKQEKGSWEGNVPAVFANRFKGGFSSLALLALREAGLPLDDPAMKDGYKYIRIVETKDTYSLALQIMVLARGDPKADGDQLKKLTKLLVKGMVRDNRGVFTGYGYTMDGGGPAGGRFAGDFSNTHFAVMALHYAREAGVEIDNEVWQSIAKLYIRTQTANGGWPYRADNPRGGELLTMTSAGLAGLSVADRQVRRAAIEFDENGKITSTGEGDGCEVRSKATGWIGNYFTLDPKAWRYYSIAALERAGTLSGQTYFSNERRPHDWYREGLTGLLRTQSDDGSWGTNRGDTFDSNPILATSWAVSFLARGRKPVAVQKLVWGDERGFEGAWNASPYDAWNLADYCGRTILATEKGPADVTWKCVDLRDLKDEQRRIELERSRVLYISGTGELKLTVAEKDCIVRYASNHGTIVVNAVKGDDDFDKSFRRLAKELWPKEKLTVLPEKHPLWTAAKEQAAKDGDLQATFKVEGITIDKRLSVIYVAQDLGFHWTAYRLEGKENERIRRAFRLGANMVTHAATGRVKVEQ